MIIIQDNFLSNLEKDKLLSLWDDNQSIFCKGVTAFYFMDLKKLKTDVSFLHNNAFTPNKLHKLRLQKYNESFEQVEDYHGHENIYNYVIFLNDNFHGGELEFESGIKITPKAGTIITFTNNEKHRILPCKGDRYTFVALGDNELDIKYKTKTRSNFI